MRGCSLLCSILAFLTCLLLYTATGSPSGTITKRMLHLNSHNQGLDRPDRILDGIATVPGSESEFPVVDRTLPAGFRILIERLPERAVMLSQPASFLEQHPELIWGAGVFFLFQTAVIIGLLIKIIERRRAERRRQEAEEALRESELIHRALFDNSYDAVFIIQNGHFARCNQRAIELFRTTKEQVIGQTPQFFSPPFQPGGAESALLAAQKMQAALDGESQVFEWVHRRFDGGLFDAEVGLNRISIGGEVTLQAVVRDITERKQSQETLRESEKLYRLLLEHAPFPAAITSLKDGSILYANAKSGELFEIPKDMPYGITSRDIYVHLEDRENLLRSLLLDGSINDHETLLRTASGRHFWALLSATFAEYEGQMAVMVALTDITSRKEAEEALANEKERLAVTLRSIGDGVITTDEEGRIALMNRVAEELTGWTSEEAAGKPLDDVFHIIDQTTRRPCENPLSKILRCDEIIQTNDHTLLISRQGREMIIADSGAPIRDREGRNVGMVLVFRDITEKEKVEESLRNAQKLEAVGLLAGGIAHDFNNLLSGLFGYVEMARMASTEPRVSECLSKALGVFGRTKDLTQQLLTFSKGGKPLKKVFSLAGLLKETTQFALSGSNVSATFSIASNLWPCEADQNQLGQVIDNLIINARQAMPEGGAIHISARNVLPSEPVPPPLAAGHYVCIAVRDEGGGISAEYLSKIFDPFFTTKQKGSGLGLTTAYSIVRKHDGQIDIESEPGQGSTFRIYLPATPKSLMIVPSRETLLPDGGGRILVMDDEDFIRDVLKTMLAEMGYGVALARDGREAIDLFAAGIMSSRPFDLVILDLTVPGGMGGKETIAELKLLDSDVKAIASSGYSEDPIIDQPALFGFQAFLIKPFQMTELGEAVQKALKTGQS